MRRRPHPQKCDQQINGERSETENSGDGCIWCKWWCIHSMAQLNLCVCGLKNQGARRARLIYWSMVQDVWCGLVGLHQRRIFAGRRAICIKVSLIQLILSVLASRNWFRTLHLVSFQREESAWHFQTLSQPQQLTGEWLYLLPCTSLETLVNVISRWELCLGIARTWELPLHIGVGTPLSVPIVLVRDCPLTKQNTNDCKSLTH